MRTSWRFVAHLGRVDRRVEDVALLAAGAAHEHGAHALRGVASRPCPRPSTLRRRGGRAPTAEQSGSPVWSRGQSRRRRYRLGDASRTSGDPSAEEARPVHCSPCPGASSRASSRSHALARGRSRCRRDRPHRDRAPRHRARRAWRRVAASSSARRSPCRSTTRSPTASRSLAVSASPGRAIPAAGSARSSFNFGGPGDAGTETLAGSPSTRSPTRSATGSTS